MSQDKDSSAGRMTGASLRTAAALLENAFTRPLLIPTAFKRLKLPMLRTREVPPEAGLYTHRHLARPPAEDGPGEGQS